MKKLLIHVCIGVDYWSIIDSCHPHSPLLLSEWFTQLSMSMHLVICSGFYGLSHNTYTCVPNEMASNTVPASNQLKVHKIVIDMTQTFVVR